MVMAKLIVNPNECAHQSNSVHIKKGESMVPMCTHTRNYGIPCTNSRTFPIGCPLQDGVAPKTTEELIKLARRDRVHGSFEGLKSDLLGKIPLIPVKSTDTVDTMLKRLSRRDRKKCIHFKSHSHGWTFYCACPGLPPCCTVVNCGHYEQVKTGALLHTTPKTS